MKELQEQHGDFGNTGVLFWLFIFPYDINTGTRSRDSLYGATVSLCSFSFDVGVEIFS
jgi:hypothetical protein